jgi:CRP-like cAMP-binding protein
MLRPDPKVIYRLRATDPGFTAVVAREAYQQFAAAASRIVPLRLQGPLSRRLALQLLDLAGIAKDGRAVTLSVTHEDLADTIGSSREVITRLLGLLAARGLVRQQGRGRLELIDRAGLLAYGQEATSLDALSADGASRPASLRVPWTE